MIPVSQFSPKYGLSSFVKSLFGNSEQGAWYDPSNMATLFQDAAGATPVTAVEQPVSLMLDNRVPAAQTGYYSGIFNGTTDYLTSTITAASNNAITLECWVYNLALDNVNGNHFVQINFSASQSNYFISHDGNGVVRFNGRQDNNTTVFNITSAANTLQINTWYHIVGVRDSSTASLYLNGTRVATTAVNTGTGISGAIALIGYNTAASPRYVNGYVSNARIVYGAAYDPSQSTITVPTIPLTAVSNTKFLTCQNKTFIDNSGNNFTITANGTPTTGQRNPFGNHAYTPPTATASRPVLSARVNLLTKTEQFDDAAWEKIAVGGVAAPSATADQGTDPNGTTTADKLNFPTISSSGQVSVVRESFTSVATSYKASVYVKAFSGSDVGKTIYIYLNDGAVKGLSSVVLSSSWQLLSTTVSLSAATSYFTIGVVGSTFGGANQTAFDALVWGADLRVANDGVGIPSYQRVNTSTDYDTVKFPMYLKFDGSDDYMLTNSVDFTGGDSITVAAGVRKLSDAALGVVTELSATIASNNGTFLLSAPNSAAANFNFSSKGTNQSDNTITTYTSPITDVLVADAKISTDSNNIRVNNGTATASSTDQGTGNYGNYAMYIGRRGGSSSPFNGRLYGAVIRAGAVSEAQASQLATYLDSKTKAY